MDNETFKTKLIKNYSDLFPNGWINIQLNTGMSNDSISISLGIISNRADQSSQIVDNDPMLHSFFFHPDPKGWQVETCRSGISINPIEQYYAMSTVKTKFRKTTGNNEKLYKTFDRFFKRLKDLLNEHQSNIYGRSHYPDKYFI